ncbi:hypothetical protein NDU88_006300 [Pleurodeles waltl]|uniref:Uncharacterized protein n=1 Tax=Pleurodeles waltl TaxID=8319 RepID=A0AAV7ULJ2_PLEWA|nr:hypothetical protein NDU88_006300 [Pleurodeles waltl]
MVRPGYGDPGEGGHRGAGRQQPEDSQPAAAGAAPWKRGATAREQPPGARVEQEAEQQQHQSGHQHGDQIVAKALGVAGALVDHLREELSPAGRQERQGPVASRGLVLYALPRTVWKFCIALRVSGPFPRLPSWLYADLQGVHATSSAAFDFLDDDMRSVQLHSLCTIVTETAQEEVL